MIKIFCDRCGKELSEDNVIKNEMRRCSFKGNMADSKYCTQFELCENCESELLRFIKGKDTSL